MPCSSSSPPPPTTRPRNSTKTLAIISDVRDKIANFDDFFRPIRSYFYWEKHCYDIPACCRRCGYLRRARRHRPADREVRRPHRQAWTSSTRSSRKLVALIPPQIASQETNRELMLTNYATKSGIANQIGGTANDNATALGQAFDAAKNDDSFYLPPEVFNNPDFKRGLKLFLSPDGKAARIIITHEGDPGDARRASRTSTRSSNAAHEALKGTPLADAKIYLGGTAATYKDIQDGANYDLLIVGIAALSLILLIMLIITRSLVAALVIVGTVALSLGASFGLSVLIWQYILGIELYWIVLALSVILLLAVGSDYNLLLVSRFKEEIDAGLKTGIIRAMAGTGSVVTAAGLVFAFTMCAFMFSDLQVLGQIGTTIGLGSAVRHADRAFVHDAVDRHAARALVLVAATGAPAPGQSMLRPYGPRPAVRQLLLWEDPDEADTAVTAR